MVEHCQMQMNLHDLGNEFLNLKFWGYELRSIIYEFQCWSWKKHFKELV